MSTEGDTMRGRIEELEVHAAFQARTIDELDDVVREFSERVRRLERELRELRGQLEATGTVSLTASGPVGDDDVVDPDARDVG
jgi:uncharacterized coiled-coil protein SlyX